MVTSISGTTTTTTSSSGANAPTVQFGGVASGLDTKGIITALMAAHQAPLLRLQQKEAAVTARKAAYQTLGTSLTDLLTKIQAFTVSGSGNLRSAVFADSTRLTAAAGTGAVPGQYRVSVDQLATATAATSTAAIGTAVTAGTAAGVMSSLPLPGTVKAGTAGVVVDGQVISVAIGDPATTSLNTALGALASAIQTRVQLTDATATVTGSVVGNKAIFTIAGAASNHSLLVGVASDTSNLTSLVGLSGSSTSTFGLGTTTVTGTALLGVVQATPKLDSAGLTGLTSTAAGVLTINGTTIAYDTTVDSLSDVLSRITNSGAGVTASIDRQNDRVILTRKSAGPAALDIQDTSGTLGAALKLAPGTTSAQSIGLSSIVTVDGRSVVSDTNAVTSAITGVTLTLLDKSTAAATLTVGVDTAGIKTALEAIATSYNSLADTMDTLANHTIGSPAGPLENDATIRGLAISLRSMLMTPAAAFTGSIQSLADLGLSSGPVNSKVGSTSRLMVDSAKLSAALATDSSTAGSLLGGSTGVLAPIDTWLKAFTRTGGTIRASQEGADAQIQALTSAQTQMQARIDAYQATLEAKFAALEATLARSQTVAASVSAYAAKLSSG
jgi:flagellar hook-associated protein 2